MDERHLLMTDTERQFSSSNDHQQIDLSQINLVVSAYFLSALQVCPKLRFVLISKQTILLRATVKVYSSYIVYRM